MGRVLLTLTNHSAHIPPLSLSLCHYDHTECAGEMWACCCSDLTRLFLFAETPNTMLLLNISDTTYTSCFLKQTNTQNVRFIFSDFRNLIVIFHSRFKCLIVSVTTYCLTNVFLFKQSRWCCISAYNKTERTYCCLLFCSTCLH